MNSSEEEDQIKLGEEGKNYSQIFKLAIPNISF